MSIRFQLGARTLLSIPKRLVRVGLGLDDALAGTTPVLPPLDTRHDGYLVTSLPIPSMAALARAAPGLIVHPRQAYVRYHADLTRGWDAYLAGLSANTRGAIRRKAKRFAAADGGALDIREYRTPGQFVEFHALARTVSATTYQEKLLASGLPDDTEFRDAMLALAEADQARGWLLFLRGQPVAYLYCPAQGDTLIYDRLGHDPAHNDLSPGAVLHAEALRSMMDEARFARFDFTEGEGQHKRAFATDGIACVDLLLLRPTLANRIALATLDRFDRAMAWGKRASAMPALRPLTRRLRRT